MVIDPRDQDDGETQHESEDRWSEMPEGEPQLTSRTDLFRRRDPDVDDQQRKRDGKDAVAENLEPCVGVRICHVVVAVSGYAVADPVAILSLNAFVTVQAAGRAGRAR